METNYKESAKEDSSSVIIILHPDIEKSNSSLSSARILERDANYFSARPTRSILLIGSSQRHSKISCLDFHLLFSSVLLLTVGLVLVTSSVWSFVVRLPLIHLAPEAFRTVFILCSYNLVSGAATLPASCMAYRAHNMPRTRNSLTPMVILLCISSVFLICGVTHGLIYRKAGHMELGERIEPAEHLRCCGFNGTNNWTTYSSQAGTSASCYDSRELYRTSTGQRLGRQREVWMFISKARGYIRVKRRGFAIWNVRSRRTT
ncbi:uncharacterized protein LOC117173868 [Belonocnema kinseyi]|uniref:uncharacterized protein LOC117173868 n=1 Tax=Belonocnema kinseyi TaxID=2817044 RepID=UPI00143E0914|nr:uncharacterized protein LOC117173868 [Belonocnema kinseyi]